MEKFFPFYKMDVNGFVFHVNEAIKLYADQAKVTSNNAIVNIDFVTLGCLQEAFGLYHSWDDLKKEDSQLVRFLIDVCPYEGIQAKQVKEVKFDERRLKLLGFLLCNGDDQEKCEELFDIIHEGEQHFMSSRDTRFKHAFEDILEIATEVVFKSEQRIFGRGPHPAVTEEAVAAARERHHELYVHFLDQVFSYDAHLPKYEWVEGVVCKQNWVLHTTLVRKMLFGEGILEQE